MRTPTKLHAPSVEREVENVPTWVGWDVLK